MSRSNPETLVSPGVMVAHRTRFCSSVPVFRVSPSALRGRLRSQQWDGPYGAKTRSVVGGRVLKLLMYLVLR